MKLAPEPLTAEAFAPFGRVLDPPADFGRIGASEGLENRRPQARTHLSLTLSRPKPLPLRSAVMERHEFSSQSFIPLDVSRYLVVVAPHGAAGGPDMGGARAFLARGDQCVTYGADVWHHPLTVLDRPGRFAVLMWQAGGAGDEEFVDLAEPIEIDPL